MVGLAGQGPSRIERNAPEYRQQLTSYILLQSSPSIPSIFSTIPILLTLSLISLVAGASIASYIVAVRHGMRHFINAVLVGGPLVFVVCGVVAFAGSLGGSGAAGDSGWKSGMRWFAFACFVISFVLARAAISRRKQVARACAIGEVSMAPSDIQSSG